MNILKKEKFDFKIITSLLYDFQYGKKTSDDVMFYIINNLYTDTKNYYKINNLMYDNIFDCFEFIVQCYLS